MTSMAAPERSSRPARGLHVDEWVDAGLITHDQADAIVAHEAARDADPTDAASRAVPVATEVAGYLAGAVAIAGGMAIVAPRWDRLALGGRLALAAAMLVVGLVAGASLMRTSSPRAARLGGAMWAVGTAGAALATGIVVDELGPRDDAWIAVAVGLSVLLVSGSLWRNRDRPLQLLGAAIGVGVTVGGLIELTEISLWIAAPVCWVSAFAFGFASTRGLIVPRVVGLGVAAVGLMAASFMFAERDQDVAAIVAVATATMIVIMAVRDRVWPIAVLGVGAFLISMSMLLGTVLDALVGQVVAVVAALAVIAVVVRGVRAES